MFRRKVLLSVCWRGSLTALVASAVVALTAHPAVATTYTWLNVGTGGWGAGSSWTPSGPPGAGDIAYFNSSSYTNQPGIASGQNRNGAVWDAGSGSLNINGAGGLTLSSTTVNGNVATGLEMDGNTGNCLISIATLTLGNNETWINNSTAGLLTVSSTAVATSGNLLTVAGSGTTTILANLNGTGGLTMSGTGGLLTLSGTNDGYSGATTISGGTLLLGNALGMQNSTLNYNGLGGTLSFGTLAAATFGGLSGSQSLAMSNASASAIALSVGNASSTTYSGILSGGSLTKNGAGTLTLAGNNTYNGSTTISAGTFALGPSGLLGSGAYAGNISFSGTSGTFNYAGSAAQTLSGAISGTGNLTMSGSNGSLTLTGSSAYGATTVTAGTLTIGPAGIVNDALSSGGMIVNGSNAVVNIQGVYNKPAPASLNIQGGGVVNLSGTMSASNGSGLKIGNGSAGTLNMTSGSMTVNLSAAAGNLNVGYGSAGLFNLTGGTVNIINLSNLRIGNNGNSSGTMNVGGSGVLLMASAGVLQLSNSANDSGLINLNSGGLIQTSVAITTGSGASGTFNFNGGTLMAGPGISGTNATNFLTVTTAYVQNGGAFINDGGNTITINQPLLQGLGSSTGGLVKTGAGSLILTGSNTYAGSTTINGGTLQLGTGASGQDGSLVSNTITNNAALVYNLFGNQVYSGAFGGGGSVTKIGTGMLTFSGNSGFNGPTTVAGGVLALSGTLANSAVTVVSGGTLASGNNAAAEIGGSLAVNGGGVLALSDSNASLTLSNGLSLGASGPSYGAGNFAALNFNLGTTGIETVNLGPGTLNVNSGGAYVNLNVIYAPSAGTLTLINFGTQSGIGQFSLSSTAANVTSLAISRDTYSLLDNANSLLLAVAAPPTPGVAYFNGAVSNIWNDAGNPTFVNWSSNLAGTTDAGNIPAQPTDVILTATSGTLSGGAVATTLGANFTINSLNVNATAASNTINADGSTLTILALADSNTGTGGGYTGNPAGNGIAIAAGAGGLTVNVPVVLGNSQTWTNGSSNALVVAGSISGSASGSSTQTLTLANTAAGGTTFSGAIGNGTAGGMLAVAINNTGSGITLFSGANTYTGSTTISAGTLELGSSTAVQNSTITVNSANGLTFLPGFGTFNIGGLSGSGSLPIQDTSGNTFLVLYVGFNGASTTYSGNLSGGGLTKVGSGTLTLAGSNSQSGTTTLFGGVLSLASANALAGGGSLTFSGGTLQYTAASAGQDYSANIVSSAAAIAIDTNGQNVTFAGNLSNFNSGGLAKFGLGTLVLTGGNNAFGGTTTIGNGTLQVGDGISSPGSLPGNVVISTTGTSLVFDPPAASVLSISGNISSTNSGSVLAMGAGMVVLDGNNTYTGGTTVSNGTLQAGSPSAVGAATGPLTVNGGVVDLNGYNITVGQLSGGAGGTILNNLSASASTLTVNSATGTSSTYAGSLSNGLGTLALTKTGAGTLYLTGINGYSGGTVIAGGGTLNVNSDSALGAAGVGITFNNGTLQLSASGFASNRPITLSGAATVDTNGFNAALSGNLTGAGNFTKFGAGTLTLGGSASTCNQFFPDAGTTIIPAGAALAASAFMSVAQNAGEIGTLQVAGSLSVGTDFNSSDNGGSTGVVYIQPGAVVSGTTLYVGKSGNSVGVLYQSGGVLQITTTATASPIAGNTSNASSASYGYYGLSAGTLAILANSIQAGAYGTGILDQSGGVLNGGGNVTVARNATSYGTYNLAGGVVNQAAAGSNLIVGYAGVGVLNVSGSGLANVTGGLIVGNNSTGNGQVNLLTGGTISTPKVSMSSGTSAFNFNGGTLKAGASSATFMQGLTSAYVYAGGAMFNTAGYSITVGQPLLAADGYGLNGGTIGVPSGGSGYLAPPAVRITGGSGFGATAMAVLNGSGNVVDLTITNPGRGYQPGDLLTATFLGGLVSGGTTGAAPLAINTSNLSQNGAGGLSLQGGGVLTLAGSNTYSGATTISSGLLTAVMPASLPGWATPGTVTVASSAALGVRTGDGVNGWNAAEIDTILGVSGPPSVTFADATSAFAFDTSNLSLAYSSNISANLSLEVLGSNTLTLAGSNSYTGTTSFTGTNGTLVLGNTAAIPGALNWTSNGNNVELNVNGATFTTNITAIPGSGRLRFISGAANVTYAGDLGGMVANLGVHGLFLNSDTSGNVQTANTLTLTGTISLGGTTPAFLNLNGPVIVAGGGLLDSTCFSELQIGASASMTIGAGGTVLLGSAFVGNNNATVTVDGGTIQHDAATAFTAVNNTGESFFINNGGLTVNTQGFNTEYPMALLQGNSGTSTGGLTKIGAGILILSGINTYSGGTTVENGTLVVDSAYSLLDGSSLIVGQDASSIFAPASAAPAGTIYAGSAASPAVAAVVPEPGTLALLLAGIAIGIGISNVRAYTLTTP